jgi:hypothetical protein
MCSINSASSASTGFCSKCCGGFRKSYHPVAILIERAANGHALISELSRRWANLIVPIDPDRRSKSARLRAHAATILAGRIHLPADAPWCDELIAEIVGFREFRAAAFTDQVDTITQFLDHAPRFAHMKSRAMTITGVMLAGYRTLIATAPAVGTPGIASRGRREAEPLQDPIFNLPPKMGSW